MASRTRDGAAVALVLATSVGIAWAVAVVVAVLDPGRLTLGGSAVLYGIGGTLIGGVVGWLSRTTKGPDE